MKHCHFATNESNMRQRNLMTRSLIDFVPSMFDCVAAGRTLLRGHCQAI